MAGRVKPTKGATILVVDDELPFRQGFARILAEQGFRVRRAVSGKQAITKALSSDIGVVLLDIAMPGRIDGIEAARVIQERSPDTAMIFCSAFVSDEVKEKAGRLGISGDFFTKPTTELQLGEILESISQASQGKSRKSEKASSVVHVEPIDLSLYRALKQHPDLMKTLDWRVFEKLLADILETFGYEIELTRGTKDGGIDIFALTRGGVWGAEKYILQAKRWDSRVGIEPVQRLLFLHSSYRATKSCLATTSTFTRGAWELADQYRWQLSLRDHQALRDWISTAADLKYGRVTDPEEVLADSTRSLK